MAARHRGGIALGVDLGGSATKIVALDLNAAPPPTGKPVSAAAGDALVATRLVPNAQAADALACIDRFARDHGLDGGVSLVAATGVGAERLPPAVLGSPVARIAEFQAVGRGGLALAGLQRALVVSVGTGTSLVLADSTAARHLGGSGMGGSALVGLGRLLLDEDDPERIAALASRGDAGAVDLRVGDLCAEEIPGLPRELTAANFGKAAASSSRCDRAAALVDMVCEVVGMMAVFACKGTDVSDAVFTGTFSATPRLSEVAGTLGSRHGLRLAVPVHAPFATAVGAVLAARGL